MFLARNPHTDRLLRTVKTASKLRSNINGTISTASHIESKLDEWFTDTFSAQSGEEAQAPQNLAILRIASVYCHILLHRTLLKTAISTSLFPHYYNNAPHYVKQIFIHLQSPTLLDLESFWFSCKPPNLNITSLNAETIQIHTD